MLANSREDMLTRSLTGLVNLMLINPKEPHHVEKFFEALLSRMLETHEVVSREVGNPQLIDLHGQVRVLARAYLYASTSKKYSFSPDLSKRIEDALGLVDRLLSGYIVYNRLCQLRADPGEHLKFLPYIKAYDIIDHEVSLQSKIDQFDAVSVRAILRDVDQSKPGANDRFLDDV